MSTNGVRMATLGRDSWDAVADVVVLGTGAAGCAAAIEAHDAGAHVLVLEKMPHGKEGGNTRVSGGAWFHNRDPERAALYLHNLCAGYPLPPAMVRRWAAETQRNTEWMARTVGAHVEAVGSVIDNNDGDGGIPPEFPELDGSDAYGGYRAVGGEMGNSVLLRALLDAVDAREIDVRFETPACSLIQDPESCAVLGVVATEPGGTSLRVRANGGVVLATGGFEANVDMVRDYLRFPDTLTWGTPYATGDGQKMAQKVGADMWHMANMMSIEGLRVPGFDSGFYTRFSFAHGFVYVGMDGHRCGNELLTVGHGQGLVHGEYEHAPIRSTHAIFDEATRRSGPISPGKQMLPVGWNVLVEGYEWSEDNSIEIEKGWIHKADTIAQLASKLAVDPAVLTATVDRYNADCDAGVDTQFDRPPQTLVPIAEPPYYGFTSAPMVAWSTGGPRRDEHSQVLDPFGEIISGLFAAGSVSSTYSWCKDGGMHIADALAFGRVAGESAAQGREDTASRP